MKYTFQVLMVVYYIQHVIQSFLLMLYNHLECRKHVVRVEDPRKSTINIIDFRL